MDELSIELIQEEIQVILLHQVANLIHLFLGIEVTGRVVLIADQDGVCAFIDQLLEFLHLRQTEALFTGGRHRTVY